jgi:hypothetical protein
VNTQQEKMSAAAYSGMSAIVYVTDPARWPGFAAMAEQAMPGGSWTEADRKSMRDDAKLLADFAEALMAR